MFTLSENNICPGHPSRNRAENHFFVGAALHDFRVSLGDASQFTTYPHNQMWTFSPRKGPDMDIGQFKGKKYPIMVTFDNLTDKDKEIVKKPKILYFKTWSKDGDLSCYLDRFEDHPLK